MTENQIRKKIPERKDVPTPFHVLRNNLMVKPLSDIVKIGNIILPETSSITLNEGHIVEVGPSCVCKPRLEVGDLVTWAQHSELKMSVDGVKFVLVDETNIIMHIPHEELEHLDDED